MPQKRNNPEPPVMTRSKSAPVIVGAAIFDLIRIFFVFFWFLGPALAGIYCTVKTSEVVGTTIAGTVCGAAAIAGGAAISAATTSFGVIMADAVGFVGFLALGLWIVMTNARILKAVATGPIQFAGAFAVAEIPFLGALPVFSVILWRLYGAQIRTEKKTHEKWKKETASAQLQQRQRNQQLAQAAQTQAAQQEQLMQIQDNQLAAADV